MDTLDKTAAVLNHAAPGALLSVRNASLAYHDGERTTYAMREVTVEIPDHEFVGIMGPSGSGKSSLLYVLSGLKRASSGTVQFGDQVLSEMSDAEITEFRRQQFGFVFQQPWLLPWQTAMENTLMGAPELGKAAENAADARLKQLGVDHLAAKLPSQLSGGEKQRVCVARAMMNDPKIIFADEPTASLDHRNGRIVVDLLSAYKSQGTVIIVTHDAEMLSEADRILIMRDGATGEWITPAELSRDRAQRGGM